ncbi:unnamed protein product [Rotaria sordida]|uniref:Uncharacterized protein n=1 Tax=Rotaria sordida TaxID=392033 RepID=A0A813TF74_9BILA|nr:unnamed protein product [Rotaria sordida]CAF0810790.1 unnamed protein product [Rotaria sordida]CAF0920239.1 unnamed protein product [Rotaria sordida]CAF0923426.1 unnamed protein product [Rotaria sordida]CAF0961232.1 unnamed protein product [Rotaria sordida]
MQPTYLYTSEFDKEMQWRSKFSIVIPIIIGFLQMILTFAIIGLEIASVVISPVTGTLYAGFWLSIIFTVSWVAMFTLVCCHRSRKCALYVFFISILCAAAAITLIVLDALFIGDIEKCFFANAICRDLESSYTRQSGIPLGRKVQVLKAQLAMAAALLATALLYMLLFILASMGSRSKKNRVVIENSQLPAQVTRQHDKRSPSPTWKAASVPVTYEPSQLECPHCGTSIRLAQKKR